MGVRTPVQVGMQALGSFERLPEHLNGKEKIGILALWMFERLYERSTVIFPYFNFFLIFRPFGVKLANACQTNIYNLLRSFQRYLDQLNRISLAKYDSFSRDFARMKFSCFSCCKSRIIIKTLILTL